jgi:hypothetical protein
MCMYSDFTSHHANANPYDGILGIGVFSPLLSYEKAYCIPSLIFHPRSVPRLFSLAKGVSGEAEIRKRHNATFVLPTLGFPQTGNEVMQACWGRERRRGAEVLRHDGVVVILTSLHSVRRVGGEVRCKTCCDDGLGKR